MSAADPTPSDPLQRTGAGSYLLVFGAAWCTPWVLLEPVLAQLEDAGVQVRRVDIDQWPQHAERFRVISVPTFVKLVGGVEKRRLIGAAGRSDLRRLMR